jgi:hypothetical protein
MSSAADTATVVPPPWKLRGDGLILLYQPGTAFAGEAGFVTPEMGEFRGGLGAAILVDYAESGVGPYRELLFVPGRFALGGKTAHAISKIYVSTETSVTSGRANWGIPKELAQFERTREGDVQSWRVRIGERDILKIAYTPGRVAFRVWTWPFSLPMLQALDDRIFLTRLRAHGVCKLASIHELSVDADCFPDLTQMTPLGVLRVSRFSLTFPVPRLLNG